MGRRVRWAVAIGVVCGGGAFAQPWQPVPTTSPEPEPVYVIRTAGQNDRTVKVLHPANPTDPASMAEVKDTATGQTFLIPGKVLAKLSKASTAQTEPPAVESKPTPAIPPVELKPEPILPPDQPPVVTPPRTEPKPPSNSVPVATTSSGEKMTTTWRADDIPAPIQPPKTAHVPPTLPPLPTTVQRTAIVTLEPVAALSSAPPSVVKSSALTPMNTDPWRSASEPKVIVPTTPAPAAVGPKLTPVPSWRTAPLPTAPTTNDPWRPTSG